MSLKPSEVLSDLIARVEAATGPDRELDALIACAADGFFPSLKPWPVSHDDRAMTWRVDFCRYDADGALISPGHGGLQMIREYTGSLDAALALVGRRLPGWGAVAGIPARLGEHGGRPWADVWSSREDERYPWAPRQMRPTPLHSNAATPALALCAALFRALALSEGQ